MCNAGSLLQQLINWSSALLFVELNFVMPVLLYVFMARRRGLRDVGCIAPKKFRRKGPKRAKRDPSELSLLSAPESIFSDYEGDDVIEGNSVSGNVLLVAFVLFNVCTRVHAMHTGTVLVRCKSAMERDWQFHLRGMRATEAIALHMITCP